MRKDDSDRIQKWAATSLTTSLTTTLTLLLTLTLCAPAAAIGFNANGAFATAVNCFSQTSLTECISVEVDTGSANGQKTTFLFYDHSFSDPNTGFLLQDTFGVGTIPNSAFQVHGQTDSLNVDTSKLSPDVFFQEFCTFDPITDLSTCNPILGGVVTGTWTAILNLLTTHSSGASSETHPIQIFITTGTSDSQTALANVNVLGAAFATGDANVGKRISTFIEVVRR